MRTSLLAAALGVLAAGCYAPDAPPGQTQVFASNPSKKSRPIEIAGGTLAVTNGGRYAVVSDPDADRVWIVDLTSSRVRGKVLLPDGSQPQRLVEDGDGRVRVALRGTGQVATISPSNLSLVGIEDACPEIRGVTWNNTAKELVAACAGGELVHLKDGNRVVTASVPDLRDVMFAKGETYVSTFRSAEILKLDAQGAVTKKTVLPSVPLSMVEGKPTSFVPAVAWRSVTTSSGDIVTVHHRTVDGDIAGIQVPDAPPAPAYYQNTCESSIVRSTVTVTSDGVVKGSTDIAGVLPVDVAVSPDGNELAVAQPSSEFVQRVQLAAANAGVRGSACAPRFPVTQKVGTATGVAYTPQNDLIVHTRTPNAVWVFSKSGGQQQITLTASDVVSDGFNVFHGQVGAIACASCHPEGGDDGHVWTLFKQQVRTQTLRGGVTETAPFHWTGRLATIDAVMQDTFVGRMGGTEPKASTISSLTAWMAQLPKPRTETKAPAEIVAQGKALFESSTAACATCHSGEHFTNNATMNVGTGGNFQVPSLRGVAARGPWMHDGCAKTLKDRFGACGGDKHGGTAQLLPTEIDAIVAYLETL